MPTAARRTRASRLIIAAAVIAAVVVPVACHKESTTAPQMQVATNTTLPASAAATTAVAGTPFSFAGGAGAISSSLTGQNLTVTFGGTAAAPTASMVFTPAAGGTGGSVIADVTFGSCIFRISAVSGSVGTLAVGQTITVNPCNFNIGTAGVLANGVAASRSIALLLGAASSSNSTVTVSVNAGGQLTLNGQAVGTVTLVPVSG